MAPTEESKIDVTVHRGHTGATQTFTLRTGGVLRIGRGIANDIVLDYAGVSVYHAELYLRPNTEPGQTEQLLCVRDESKNGTGVRSGPHALDGKKDGDWEPLKKGALRVLEHGWQLLVPMQSRKENLQMPEAPRVLTVYIGTKVGPIGGEDLDGEAWEPGTAIEPIKAIYVPTKAKKGPKNVPPPPPDLGGGAFEEAPPPPEALASQDSDEEAGAKKDKNKGKGKGKNLIIKSDKDKGKNKSKGKDKGKNKSKGKDKAKKYKT
jgi:hypothetical protein